MTVLGANFGRPILRYVFLSKNVPIWGFRGTKVQSTKVLLMQNSGLGGAAGCWLG